MINTNTLLNLLAPNLTASTKGKIENLAKDGKVEISSLIKDTTIKTLLDGLLKDLATGEKSRLSISKLLQNSKPIFDLKLLSTDMKDILKYIKANPKLQVQTKVLEQFRLDIKNLDSYILKSNISNSGIFLESKLLNKQDMQNDIKAILLQVQEHLDSKGANTPKEIKLQMEKVLSQIEFYQLSSYCSQNNHTFLPFDWNNIDSSDIEFNSNKKESFSCSINLSLKDKGDINIMLLLDNKNNLNINMNVEKEEFKGELQSNMQTLRQSIINIGLCLQSLNIMDIQNQENKTYEEKAYGSNINLNFGLDIKA